MKRTKDLHPNLTLAKRKGAELAQRQETLRAKLFDVLPTLERALPPSTPLVVVTGVRGAGVSFASNLPRDEARLMLQELLDHLNGRRVKA